MPSTLSWLNYSEQERRKFLDVVKLFRDQGTVDELGVGAIRDGFSDLLFPGTSTLHTRAGYLLFVPWIYRIVETTRWRSQDPWRSARNLEVWLIDELAQSDDSEGTIGIYARAALKTFPSTLYWAALGTYRIRQYRGSQEQYHRWIAQGAGRRVRALLDDEGEPVASEAAAWDPGCPDPPKDFPAGASFALRGEHAAYLQQRITTAARDAKGRETLLAWMLAEGVDGSDYARPSDLASHPGLSGHLRIWLEHAGRFSLAINGAPLLYNLMLAEAARNDERQDHFRTRIAEWAAEVRDTPSVHAWDRDEFWAVIAESPAQVTPPTRRFVDRWLDLALGGDLGTLAENASARSLIVDRERQVKRRRARLVHRDALRLWGGDSGTTRLDYRWTYVTRTVGDILRPLSGGTASARG